MARSKQQSFARVLERQKILKKQLETEIDRDVDTGSSVNPREKERERAKTGATQRAGAGGGDREGVDCWLPGCKFRRRWRKLPESKLQGAKCHLMHQEPWCIGCDNMYEHDFEWIMAFWRPTHLQCTSFLLFFLLLHHVTALSSAPATLTPPRQNTATNVVCRMAGSGGAGRKPRARQGEGGCDSTDAEALLRCKKNCFPQKT